MITRKERHLLKSLSQLETRVNRVSLNLSDTLSIAADLYEGLDTPTSLGLYLCLRHGDILSVIRHEIKPSDYTDVDLFRRSYQAVSFLRKMAYKVDGLDPSTTALESFRESEALCAETNRAFRKYRSEVQTLPRRVHEVLHLMTRDIAAILGGFDPVTWMLSCQFGPGAAYGSPGSSAYDKIGAKPTVTPGFAHLGTALINMSPVWVDAVLNQATCPTDGRSSDYRKALSVEDINVVPGGTYCQVPKSAKTNRNIEVQPNLNAFAQMGLGRMIRQKLKIAGLDLRTQQDRNRAAAHRGSKTGRLATIDLSSASDTIAYELVLELFPQRWFFAMDSCRTTHIQMDPNSRPLGLERFSSMGNGYTFELESLIFWALVRACRRLVGCNDEYHVFGDDIICSTPVANLVVEILPFLGFKVNAEKSFISGVFRESCGQDFYNGTNVRPYFYKKGDDNSDLQAIVSLANGLRRASWRSNNRCGCCSRYRRAWVRCLQRIPRDIRSILIGPWSETDQWLIAEDDEWHRNPAVFRDRATWSLKMPSLEKRSADKTVKSYPSARAAMLYALERSSLTWQSDELTLSVSRIPRKSSLFSVPLEHSERQRLDVSSVEIHPGLYVWL